ncbi:MAG: inorganic phosphate transporter [Gammaproteobacteria bacterium]|nr:inorganic phosphate transporter [Gammaproteobacteria bacterium]
MEFRNISEFEKAFDRNRSELLHLGLSLFFLFGVWIYVSLTHRNLEDAYLLIVAAVIGGYMAMNIGANDVANNVGPAVGSQALTMAGAIMIAGFFEAAGALIAGGEVVSTIKGGIIDPSVLPDAQTFIWLMMAALLAGALWLNLATWLGAPVSTTHSIVGGVLGAGVAAGGWAIADWGVMAKIAASWVVSPVMGGVVAALILFAIKKLILYRRDVVRAAQRVVPWILALMAWAFITYIMLKGVTQIWKVGFITAALTGLVAAVLVLLWTGASLRRKAATMVNSRDGVNNLFTVPLIFAAALLSFAHGANDVANAVGPLAAINDALNSGGVHGKASIPLWIMMVGALGIVIGLALFGPRLIRTVGSEITELDKTRAFCIALSAAITVILASQLGLPISSTHTALGAVFGVGFLREYLKVSYASQLHGILDSHEGAERERLQRFLDNFRKASVEDMGRMIKMVKKQQEEVVLTKAERKRLKEVYREELVKRHQLFKIAAAWIVTVPASALMGALLFYTLRGMLLQG